MGAPRGDSAVTRKVILAAARDLFATHGVDGVSVRQIAAAAGVNHALVHRYFGTKERHGGGDPASRGSGDERDGRPTRTPSRRWRRSVRSSRTS